MKICGGDIYQFLSITENSTSWCVHIQSHLFDHILTLGKHLRSDFFISVEDMLEYDIDDLLDVVSVAIA